MSPETPSSPDRPLVAVIGGGVTGLAAAHRLVLSGRVAVKLFERAERTGGVVATVRDAEGRVLETGPDCFISTKPWARELAVELGLEGELRNTTGKHRRSFVVSGGRLEPIPEGFHLLAPTLVRPFLASRVVSWRGKLRAGLEALLPRRQVLDEAQDEALESFVRRRLGGEVFERLVEPLVGGIYTADARELSLRATFPKFLDLEREHGSVIRGLWAERRSAAGAEARAASGARYGLFLTLAGGLGALTDRLAAGLPAGVIESNTEVHEIKSTPGGFELTLAGARKVAVRGVVVALPAPAAARVLEPLDAGLSRALTAIPYASAATVNVLLRREQVRHPLDGMGFIVPSRERRFVLACTFSSEKFLGRVPPGEVLLRAFVGGATRRADAELPPDELGRRTVEELRDRLGIEGEPTRVLVRAWPESMPQYLLGHLGRVAAIEDLASRIPGLALAGNAFRGVGVPDCVRSADAAAKRVLATLAASAK